MADQFQIFRNQTLTLFLRNHILRNLMRSIRLNFKAMTSLVSTSKAAVRQLIRVGCLRSNPKLESLVLTRCFRSIASIESFPPSYQPISGTHHVVQNTPFNSIVQRRRFLGCGDGDQGGKGLSKVHEEKCVMGYSPEQMYAVVAAVDMYQEFLPWCRRSDIVQRHPDGSFDAELEIGFQLFVESYVSHVKVIKPRLIKTTSSQSSLFNHLINTWEFHPGPVPGTCNLHFLVDFKFQSPLYSQMASMFFKEVASRLVSSFSERCRLIYGPGVPVPNKSIDKRT